MPTFSDYEGKGESPSVYSSSVQYSDEELAFLKAIDKYKREQRRPYPSWREVLDIAKSLGYRKVNP